MCVCVFFQMSQDPYSYLCHCLSPVAVPQDRRQRSQSSRSKFIRTHGPTSVYMLVGTKSQQSSPSPASSELRPCYIFWDFVLNLQSGFSFFFLPTDLSSLGCARLFPASVFSPFLPTDFQRLFSLTPLQGTWQPNPANGLQKKGWELFAHLLREPAVSEQCLQMNALQSGHVGTLLNPRESLSLVVGGGNNIRTSGAVLEQNSLKEQRQSHENAHELWNEGAGCYQCCSFVTKFCSLALSKATGQPPVKEESEEPRSWTKTQNKLGVLVKSPCPV